MGYAVTSAIIQFCHGAGDGPISEINGCCPGNDVAQGPNLIKMAICASTPSKRNVVLVVSPQVAFFRQIVFHSYHSMDAPRKSFWLVHPVQGGKVDAWAFLAVKCICWIPSIGTDRLCQKRQSFANFSQSCNSRKTFQPPNWIKNWSAFRGSQTNFLEGPLSYCPKNKLGSQSEILNFAINQPV